MGVPHDTKDGVMGARAHESGWRQVELSVERMVLNGFLTEGDAYEVLGLMDELIQRARRGEITSHFVHVVLKRLAEQKVAAWRARYGGVGL
jgi:hypothetical protein